MKRVQYDLNFKMEIIRKGKEIGNFTAVARQHELDRQLAHPKLKFQFDVFILASLALLVIKLVVLLLKKVTDGGSFFWNFGSLILMIGVGIGSRMLKKI
ncbi:hypothetical protein [Paenibacillus agricola]|uniref:Uncharacterized protein n=1 Tax=Paenibacillus agricola TaxID=2716264 RepID=A0ABX0JCZ6_9BACL|nr:hypothetical protein [Paenibacillus agricola]NHN32623.1 hypothetical protein [Paenibacillus agricola]